MNVCYQGTKKSGKQIESLLATKEENFDGAGDGEVGERDGADGSDRADKFVRDYSDVVSLVILILELLRKLSSLCIVFSTRALCEVCNPVLSVTSGSLARNHDTRSHH